MIDVNNFIGASDSEVLEAAFSNIGADRIIVIPPRSQITDTERHYWLIDRAILIPENTTVILRNCRIKLSDKCRDNFFRTANCGFGFPDPRKVSNIHIRGEGICVLEGADHPRATGDGAKLLSCPYPAGQKVTIPVPSYGTDAGNTEESQYGDWRNVGILFANVENFSVENIQLVRYHGWGISFEACSHGVVRNITFHAAMHEEIDGTLQTFRNQDGVNLRNGCHHVLISDIFGETGDDVIALTAHKGYNNLPGGSLRTTHVMHTDYTRREADIHDVIIRNVLAKSRECCMVRLLPSGTQIWNITIDGVVDTAEEPDRSNGAFVFGTRGNYGSSTQQELHHITISNVISSGRIVFDVQGYWCDSVVSNVINKNPNAPMFKCHHEDGMERILTNNLLPSI